LYDDLADLLDVAEGRLAAERTSIVGGRQRSGRVALCLPGVVVVSGRQRNTVAREPVDRRRRLGRARERHTARQLYLAAGTNFRLTRFARRRFCTNDTIQ